MIDFDIEQLRQIGLNSLLINTLYQLPAVPEESDALMRVVEVQRDCFCLHDGAAEHRARALPWLLQETHSGQDSIAIGDWVTVSQREHGESWINSRLPAVTQIARRANDGRRQVLASNVDTALLVMGLDHDFNPRRMERYIALVSASGVAPLVVWTKADIGHDVHERAGQLRLRLPASVPIVTLNTLDAASVEQLSPWLGFGQTLVMLGASGTGKSTLTNTLTRREAQSTGGVRHGDGRGRHTTTARSLHLCSSGACIIDTPGLRTWRPDADEKSVASAFEDIEALAANCHFRDCRHESEPGCAVREHIAEDRLRNYRKLLRDVQRSQQTPLEKIALRARWKAIGKAGTERLREKRRL
jgi:ribosome biogenesis GTPase / thiamine phosphate phosphatase